MEIGKRKPEIGNWRVSVRASCRFPISSFQLPVSVHSVNIGSLTPLSFAAAMASG
jgi:hypothetical protein